MPRATPVSNLVYFVGYTGSLKFLVKSVREQSAASTGEGKGERCENREEREEREESEEGEATYRTAKREYLASSPVTNEKTKAQKIIREFSRTRFRGQVKARQGGSGQAAAAVAAC
ncbi:hypothetical protein E2C01_082027 [Portunus trituberculatus]|uniref:Uncharacterized protein n=1 Tax=Portunus trituberculatus TaxID=210409 RepID=A0A5B7IXD3_PORTR|nr:hypothetical protein [Portunus trituberculatus]